MKFPICYIHDCIKQAAYYLIKQHSYICTNDFQYEKIKEPYEYEDSNVVPLIEPSFVQKKIENALRCSQEFRDYLEHNCGDNEVVQICTKENGDLSFRLTQVSVDLIKPCEGNKYIKFFESLEEVAVIEKELNNMKLYQVYMREKAQMSLLKHKRVYQKTGADLIMNHNDFKHCECKNDLLPSALKEVQLNCDYEEKKEPALNIDAKSNENDQNNMSKKTLISKLEQMAIEKCELVKGIKLLKKHIKELETKMEHYEQNIIAITEGLNISVNTYAPIFNPSIISGVKQREDSRIMTKSKREV
ncbi:unnamed protein product [Moneuplotes crassus]|uniref:Uncharacterized protein n=1 Tax=Euplotes crassus TaxID=5936 RepID=A0AAD1XB69_EUPCR|nr:unnamed protein product [Moneuplotes crassus]